MGGRLFRAAPSKMIKELLLRILPAPAYNALRRVKGIIPLKLRLLKFRANTGAFPEAYHFLMTNFCNARCIFCDQKTADDQKAEITLDAFKRMISHLRVKSARTFFFSGGESLYFAPTYSEL